MAIPAGQVRPYSLLGVALTASIFTYNLNLRFLYRNWVLNPMHHGIGFQAAVALTLGALSTKRPNIGLFPLAVAPN